MALTQGQVNELLRLVTQQESLSSDIVPKLLANTINENFVISYIRKGLASSTEHQITLKLLSNIVLHFSHEVLRDHLIYFMETVLNSKGDCGTKFQFLGIAVKYTHPNEDVNKSKVLLLIPKIVERCIAVDKHALYETESLSCLAACLELYSSTCGPYKSRIETHLSGYLSYEKSGFAIGQAAKCFHYLQQCGPQGVDSINHVQNWTNALNKVCLTIRELLECVKDANHGFQPNSEGALLFPLGVDHSTNAGFFVAEHRLLNLLRYLRALIELKYPCQKVLKPQLVIGLLESSLNKHPTRNDSIESFCSNSVQIRIETQLFYIFRSFIALMKLNLVPFSNKIMKMLTDRLHETRGDQFKDNSEYKEALYKLIAYFVKTMKNNVSSQFHKKLLESLLDDIKPITENITLNVPNIIGSSTKNRQQITESQTIANGVRTGNVNGGSNVIVKEKICCSALDCLKECFRSMILNVKYNMLKHIYKTLCETLVSIQNGMTTPPYLTCVSTCKLYETVVAALEQIHPPPIQVVLKLLLVGQSSGNSEISGVCTTGVMLIEKICQPVRPLIFSTSSSKNYIGSGDDDGFHLVESTEIQSKTIESGASEAGISESRTSEDKDSESGTLEGRRSETRVLESRVLMDRVVENWPQPQIEHDENMKNEELEYDSDENVDSEDFEMNDTLERNMLQIHRDSPEQEEPPRKLSRQIKEEYDDIPLADMLSSFKDVPSFGRRKK